MSKLKVMGLCGMGISIWGILQMGLLSLFYKLESFTLLEDAMAEEYEDVLDFIEKTKFNYLQLSFNCGVVAFLYVVSLALCFLCYKRGKRLAKVRQALLEDDEIFCVPPEIENPHISKLPK